MTTVKSVTPYKKNNVQPLRKFDGVKSFCHSISEGLDLFFSFGGQGSKWIDPNGGVASASYPTFPLETSIADGRSCREERERKLIMIRDSSNEGHAAMVGQNARPARVMHLLELSSHHEHLACIGFEQHHSSSCTELTRLRALSHSFRSKHKFTDDWQALWLLAVI